MANIYPSQTRSVDPYSSYNSNTVNRLTRMITRGNNCLHDIYSIDIEADTTSPLTCVVVKEGTAFMNDVYISITSDFIVDFEESDFYLDVNPFNETGYYYVILDYYYVKAKPAPQMSIKILKPTQRAIIDGTDRYALLKVIQVIWNGSTFEIVPGFFDYDPENPTRRRMYADLYCGVEDIIPTFDPTRDVSRLIYVKQEQEFYFGANDQWEAFSSVRYSIDTTLCSDGQLAYMNSAGEIRPAIATSSTTYASCVVLNVGVTDGKVRLVGAADDVPIESGITLTVGERLFLSSTEAGSVTNVLPPGVDGQYIGSCVGVDPGGTTCSIWFIPSGSVEATIVDLASRVSDLESSQIIQDGRLDGLESDSTSLDSRITALEGEVAGGDVSKIQRDTITAPGDWSGSAGSYSHTITLGPSFTYTYQQVQCYDTSTRKKIDPMDIEFLTGPNRVVIWMPVNTVSVYVVISGN